MFEAFPDQSTRPAGSWPGIFALTVGLPVVIALMLFAFLAPSFGSGPKDLPIAISGPDNAVPELTQSIEDRSPDAFEIRAVDDAGAVRAAVRDREAVGGIAIDPTDRTTTIYTAAGNGTPYATLLHNIAAGKKPQGQDVEIIDLAPLTEDDPTGAGLAALGLPLAFGGMASAAILILLFAGRPWHTLTGALTISIAAGCVVAAILQYGYRSMDTDYFAAAIAIAAGIAATSLLVTGLGALIGLRAIGIGAIFTIFVSNPLSGLATGWWWLPKPWGEIGQYLPIGSAGHLLRSIAFFDGNGAGRAWAVLLTWMMIGIALNAYGGISHRARSNPENENLERVNA